MSTRTSLLTFITLAAPCLAGQDWAQDLGNAQRTGFTSEEPKWPWTFAWTWNGPDAQGGIGEHRYHQPRPHEPWEARICTGNGMIFVPAGELGLYALRMTDGSVVWQFKQTACHTAPAYDAAARAVFVGTEQGIIYKLAAATGQPVAQQTLAKALNKSVLLTGEQLFALATDGSLHKLEAAGLSKLWVYEAGASASTLPSYSAAKDAVVFCTSDLNVHCVAGQDGSRHWRVKPTPLESSSGAEFTGGWPVIAEKHGLVFVRLAHGDINKTLWSGGESKGKWPATNRAIRQRLNDHPELKNLFALRLDSGEEAFVPAVGPAGVEDLRNGKPFLRVHSLPVIRKIEDREVAYLPWRNGDTKDPKWDGRWDSHLGEMVLDDTTIPGLQAGDFRFVEFREHGGWVHITDEACPLSMAGDTLFSAHWDVSQSAQIKDRSPDLGLTRAKPIRTEKRPPVVRHLMLLPDKLDPASHWATGGLNLVDGRYIGGPGWWNYANVLDPPTPKRDAYSEGILPRYTCVANGLIIVQGNGGDLFVLKYSQ